MQPQWIFDSVNRQRLLSVDDYASGSILPPHLSPFVEEGEQDYMPPEREKEIREREEEERETQVAEEVIPEIKAGKCLINFFLSFLICKNIWVTHTPASSLCSPSNLQRNNFITFMYL